MPVRGKAVKPGDSRGPTSRMTLVGVVEAANIRKLLAALRNVPETGNFQVRLAVNGDEAQRLGEQGAGFELIAPAELAESLAKAGATRELIEYVSYSLLSGAAAFVMPGVPDDLLARLGQVVETLVPQPRPVHLADPEGPVCFAITEAGDRGKIDGHSARITQAVFNRQGNRLMTTALDRTARIWDARRGRAIATLSGGGHEIKWPQFSPDPQNPAVVGVVGNLLNIWDSDYALRWQSDTSFYSAQFSPDGAHILATVAMLGLTQVLDAHTLEQQHTLPGIPVYSPDGSRLTIVSHSGSSSSSNLHDPRTFEMLHPISGQASQFSADGARLVTSDWSVVKVWDVDSGSKLWELRDDEAFAFAGLSPDGRRLLTQDYHAKTCLWDIQTRQALWTREFTRHLVGFSPDGGSIYDSDPFALTLYDAESGSVRFKGQGGIPVFGGGLMAVSEFGWGDSAVENGYTEVTDLREGKSLYRIAGRRAVFSPNARQLITLLDDGRAIAWDARSGQELFTMGGIRVLMRAPRPPSGGEGGEEEEPATPLGKWHKGIFYRFEALSKSATSPQAFFESTLREADGAPRGVERFVAVDAPSRVLPERVFTLEVTLAQDFPDDTEEAATRPLRVGVTRDSAGNPTGVPPVRVRLYSFPGFDPAVQGSQSADLEVYAEKDTPPAQFRLKSKPGVTGPQEIELNVAQGYEPLGSIRVIVQVLAQAAPGKRQHVTLRYPDALAQLKPALAPDVVIRVDCRTSEGRDTLNYSYQNVQQGWQSVDAGSLELKTSAQEWMAERYETLTGQARELGPGSKGAEAESIGQNLYNALFTPELKAFYRQFSASAKTLLLYSNEPWIPWELLKPWGSELDPAACEFLCLRFEMSRWYYSNGQRIRLESKLRVISAIAPAANLLAAGEEVAYLNGLPQRWPNLALTRPLPRLRDEVLELMSAGTTNLFHFATHGTLPEPGAGVAAIAVGSESLRVDEIVGEYAQGLQRSAPLVFINACHSARQAMGLTRADGWVERMLEFGCSGFIGANWQVHDQLASRFAIDVYDALLDGQTIARAVRSARLNLRADFPANSTWLAYSLYAHPNMRIQVG
jgi:WD40 repeat protein